MPECINLDDLTIDPQELLRVAQGIDSQIAALTTQRKYITEKAKAMEFRKAGSIDAARRAERRCDEIYKTLPQELKW